MGRSGRWSSSIPADSHDSFPAIDYFERSRYRSIIALKCFDGARRYEHREAGWPATSEPELPSMLCDATQQGSCKDVLIARVEHVRDASEEPLSEDRLDSGVQQYGTQTASPCGRSGSSPYMASRRYDLHHAR